MRIEAVWGIVGLNLFPMPQIFGKHIILAEKVEKKGHQ